MLALSFGRCNIWIYLDQFIIPRKLSSQIFPTGTTTHLTTSKAARSIFISVQISKPCDSWKTVWDFSCVFTRIEQKWCLCFDWCENLRKYTISVLQKLILQWCQKQCEVGLNLFKTFSPELNTSAMRILLKWIIIYFLINGIVMRDCSIIKL